MGGWLRRGLSDSRRSMSGALGALDDAFNPGAARARDLLEAQHERVIPTPSPGDRLLSEGRIVIEQPVRVDPANRDGDDADSGPVLS